MPRAPKRRALTGCRRRKPKRQATPNKRVGDVGGGCGNGDSGGEGDGGNDGCSECNGDGSDHGGGRGDDDSQR